MHIDFKFHTLLLTLSDYIARVICPGFGSVCNIRIYAVLAYLIMMMLDDLLLVSMFWEIFLARLVFSFTLLTKF